MKSKVLERKMFKNKEPEEVANPEDVGIMQGFIEMISSEEIDEKDAEEYETNRMMGRTPDSPEIIMNNLRGDMKSVDARREELADKVGYNVAMETPDEVLALLQDKFAQEDQQGLASLAPQGMPPGMPPGMMPAGGPPMLPPALPPEGIANLPTQQGPMPAPIPMKDGGIVQNFRNGSLPSGVTPIVQRFANGTGPNAVQPLTLESLMKQQPSVVPDLASSITSSKELAERLGAGYSKDVLTANLLAQASPAFFDFAKKGDTLDLLKNLSGAASQTAALKAKSDQDLLKVAIPLATSSRDAAIAANEKLKEAQIKVLTEREKNKNKGLYGSSLKGRARERVTTMTPQLIQDAAQFLPENLYAFTVDVSDMKIGETITKMIKDPLGRREPYPVTEVLPSLYDKLDPQIRADIDLANEKAIQQLASDQKVGKEDVFEPDQNIEVEEVVLAEDTSYIPPKPPKLKNDELNYSLSEYTEDNLSPKEKYEVNTLWDYSRNATGPYNIIIGDYLPKLPFFGDTFAEAGKKQTQAISFFRNAQGRIINSLREGDKFTVGEMNALIKELDIKPAFWDSPVALQNKLISLDNSLIARLKGFAKQLEQGMLNTDAKKKIIEKAEIVKNIRRYVGMPTRVPIYRKENNKPDEEKILKTLIEIGKKNNGNDFQYLYKKDGTYVVETFSPSMFKKGK